MMAADDQGQVWLGADNDTVPIVADFRDFESKESLGASLKIISSYCSLFK